MARYERSESNRHLPKGWSWRKGALYYAVPAGQREKWDGKALYRLGSTEAEAYATFSRRLGSAVPVSNDRLEGLLQAFLVASTGKLAEKTLAGYRSMAPKVLTAFKDAPPEAITPQHCYQYLKARGKIEQARKEIRLLSSALSWGVQEGLLATNPILGQVRLRRQGPAEPRPEGLPGPRPTPREGRYVPDDVLNFALRAGPPQWLRDYVELKLLTGLRCVDLRGLKAEDWNPETGLRVLPSKTRNFEAGGPMRFLPSPGLKALMARLTMGLDRDEFLFRTDEGKAFCQSSFSTAWQRWMERVTSLGGARFQERALRRKVATDVSAAQAVLGHSSPKTTEQFYIAERVVNPAR